MAQTAPTLAIDGTRPTRLGHLTLRVAEDHPAADRLKNSHDGDRELGTDVPRAILDDDHGAVLEVADGLAGLFAFLDHAHGNLLARQNDWTDGLREVVHVEHGDALELRDA